MSSGAAGSILVVDGTGRGHALCELFTRTDPNVTVLYGPGNPHIRSERIVSVDGISLTDPATAIEFLRKHPVDFVFVANIDALSRGYVERLRAAGHQVIGPSSAAAELESSKRRGKRFCLDHNVPTARWRAFTDPAEAKAYIAVLSYACVVKTDGLTADGDGAYVCDTATEAELAVDRIAAGNPSGFEVVIEERLYGQELSVFVLLDHQNYLLLPTALDFKRSLDGDAGKNCDGMGSICPHPAQSPELLHSIRRDLLAPIMRGLRTEQLDFTGFLYVGCMITDQGLRVIELNARFGDSEAEVVLPAITSNFRQICCSLLAGRLDERQIECDGLARCSVALTQGCLNPDDPVALPGWPFGAMATGQRVSGLDDVDAGEASVFFAHLGRDGEGFPITTGGRVAHVVGAAETPGEARERAYRQLARVDFAGLRVRADIGDPSTGAVFGLPGQGVGALPAEPASFDLQGESLS